MAAKDGVVQGRPGDPRAGHEGRGHDPRGLHGRRHRRTCNSKRGQIDGIDERGSSRVIRAHVPLAEMFGYATELRSMTQGRAAYSMEFSRYAEVPTNLANELIAKSKS